MVLLSTGSLFTPFVFFVVLDIFITSLISLLLPGVMVMTSYVPTANAKRNRFGTMYYYLVPFFLAIQAFCSAWVKKEKECKN